MAKAIRSYMGEEITAFQFDDALGEASNATDDKTVQTLGRALWYHYDDCKDHKVVASKEEWDYFNRLLLLLESDGEMETVKSWRSCHPLQGAAAMLFIGFLFVAIPAGFGEHLFAYALPFGPPSMLLGWLNSRRRKRTTHSAEIALTPFSSISSLLTVRRQVGGFVKHHYPHGVAGRTIRDPIINKLMWLPWSIAWCMFSPVVLFFQMLPEGESEIRIRMPEPSAVAYALPRAAQP